MLSRANIISDLQIIYKYSNIFHKNKEDMNYLHVCDSVQSSL